MTGVCRVSASRVYRPASLNEHTARSGVTSAGSWPDRAPSRIAVLDSLRGVLAVIVLVHHVLLEQGDGSLDLVGTFCVMAFFTMSGFVLARAYDGRPLAFVVRRVIRLWPLYAVCMLIGYAVIARQPPSLAVMLWFPLPAARTTLDVDPAAWSLYYEAWMTPVFPVLFWVARQSRLLGLLTVLLAFALVFLDARAFSLIFFTGGVAAAGFGLETDRPCPGLLLWLGKVSFSLYLSHQIVLHVLYVRFGLPGLLVAVPLCFAVASLLCRFVERPSIDLSRRAVSEAGGYFYKRSRKLSWPGYTPREGPRQRD